MIPIKSLYIAFNVFVVNISREHGFPEVLFLSRWSYICITPHSLQWQYHGYLLQSNIDHIIYYYFLDWLLHSQYHSTTRLIHLIYWYWQGKNSGNFHVASEPLVNRVYHRWLVKLAVDYVLQRRCIFYGSDKTFRRRT